MTGERFTTPDDLWYVEDDALYNVRNRSQWGSVSGPGALAAAVKYGAHKALADRDTALGRLRSVKHPDWVVYPDWQGPDVVSVLDELSAIQNTYRRGDPITSRVGSAIAAEYFAAHPVAEPKPWEDAKFSEVWALTIDGVTRPGFRNAVAWQGIGFDVPIDSPRITAGEPVWKPTVTA